MVLTEKEKAALKMQLQDGRVITADDSVNHMDMINFITETMYSQDKYIRKVEVITQIVMKITAYTHSKAIMRLTGDLVEVDVYVRKTSMDPIFEYSCQNSLQADKMIDNLMNFYHAADVSTRKEQKHDKHGIYYTGESER